MQDTELAVTATLCLVEKVFHISTNNSYLAFAGMRVLVCGQNIILYYSFFEGGPTSSRHL